MKDVPTSARKSLQEWAKLIAINVRNRMESFHCEHLSDQQMKALNPIIRNAIYESLHAMYCLRSCKNESQRIYGAVNVSYWLMLIPDYWETPDLPQDVADRLRRLTAAELRKMPSMSTEKSRSKFQQFCSNDLFVFEEGEQAG